MILLDTSFLVAYYNERDVHHKKAKEIMDKIYEEEYGETYINDYIFDELSKVLWVRFGDLKKVINTCEPIKKILTVEADKNLFERAWQIFKNQESTSFSFTDCFILSSMEGKKIKHIATFDKDFSKIKDIIVVN